MKSLYLEHDSNYVLLPTPWQRDCNLLGLMQDFLAPNTTPSPPHRAHLPRHQRQKPRLGRIYRNTTQHVLFTCPLHTSPRQRIFGIHTLDSFVFGTEDGGRKLGEFQRTTNRLLRPLPPRPDPP